MTLRNEADQELLVAYLLGELRTAEAARVEARCAEEPDLRAALAELSEGLDHLIGGEPPIPNPAGARTAFELALHDPFRRWDPFLDPLSTWFDVDEEQGRAILALLETGTWASTGVDGVWSQHFQAGPGPRSRGAETGLVRFEKGARYPLHRHMGPEVTIMLQGTLHFSTGEVLRRGDIVVLEGNTEHELFAGDEEEVIYVVLHHGIEHRGE